MLKQPLMRTSRLLSSLVVLALAACNAPGGRADNPPPGETVGSNLPRALSAAPAADVTAAVTGNTDFAFDVYRQLTNGNSDNVFYSPHSITVALAMTYGGAVGATATAFEQTLHISLPAQRYHDAINDLDQALASRGTGATAAYGAPLHLTNAYQLFAQQGFSFAQPFLDLLATDYGSSVKLLDFETQAEPSRLSINGWVAAETDQRILNLLAQGTIDSSTRAVLVNAIYFNASWAQQFDKTLTTNQPFTHVDGTTSSVPMMRAPTMQATSSSVDGTDIVSIPYDGDELSAIVIAPPAGQLAALESSLSSASLGTMLDGLKGGALDLQFPSFQVTASENLTAPLTALGLGLAFSNQADFSGMSTQAHLSISGVVHQAFVKVDESGTEAAAATAVIIRTSAVEQRPAPSSSTARSCFSCATTRPAPPSMFAGRITAP